MHVKTYVGTNSHELLAQINRELGPDAVVIGNRSFRKSGIRYHEMTVGVENNPIATGAGGHVGKSVVVEKISNVLNSSAGYASDNNAAGWSDWRKEWMQIKEYLFALMKPSIQLERLTPRQRVALEYLQREGVSDSVILELYRRLLSSPGASVLESISKLLPVRAWGWDLWPQKFHAIVGPYGAGKTTTAIRMAIELRRQRPSCKIAFINADCNRASGRLILRHWAELSDFSCYEVASADVMRRALVACAEYDKVFIDMPGLGRQDLLSNYIAKLGLDSSIYIAYHLVMAPHYDSIQNAAFLSRYEIKGDGSLIWTKLDEAISYGSIVNVAAACRLPVSALSYGAGLQRSLVNATEPVLWRLIFKRQLPG